MVWKISIYVDWTIPLLHFQCVELAVRKSTHKYFTFCLASFLKAGDADTNGAVAGALLACKLGLPAIPQPWRDGLVNKDWLMGYVNRSVHISILNLMDICLKKKCQNPLVVHFLTWHLHKPDTWFYEKLLHVLFFFHLNMDWWRLYCVLLFFFKDITQDSFLLKILMFIFFSINDGCIKESRTI